MKNFEKMNRKEVKDLIIKSLYPDTDTSSFPEKLGNAGAFFSFSGDFTGKVLDRLTTRHLSAVVEDPEFIRGLNSAFYRIALTGVAAIIILLISIFISEGSLSLNSFLGMGNNVDETIICLLTGN